MHNFLWADGLQQVPYLFRFFFPATDNKKHLTGGCESIIAKTGVRLGVRKEKELRNHRNPLIFNVVPTGLEPVTP